MEYLHSLDFLTGVNPTLKVFVYVLIMIHILAVSAWCVLACPSMFKQSDSFPDKVQRALNKQKNQ